MQEFKNYETFGESKSFKNRVTLFNKSSKKLQKSRDIIIKYFPLIFDCWWLDTARAEHIDCLAILEHTQGNSNIYLQRKFQLNLEISIKTYIDTVWWLCYMELWNFGKLIRTMDFRIYKFRFQDNSRL